MSSRSLYIDIGANIGDTIAEQMAAATVDHCWAIEPNPTLCAALRQRFDGQRVDIIEMAAWTAAGVMPLYLGDPVSSTLLEGKVTLENYPQYAITYDQSVEVQTLDLAQWLRTNVGADDNVIVKMDIEGAEYQVLQHLLDNGAIDLVDEPSVRISPRTISKRCQCARPHRARGGRPHQIGHLAIILPRSGSGKKLRQPRLRQHFSK
ncbi:FkbM family methyltransferase [Devosia algicola]|uniref:FkbM family methyltransferase n=1 Tax=Devosia algicola TaxID=3026418 RepID=A0ABY7YMZ9_9HYPH|nr:FkbM family methyltransferase [Devosia algicola]WDR02533.1 FkbM family methyltransferase [Devosia algicola]